MRGIYKYVLNLHPGVHSIVMPRINQPFFAGLDPNGVPCVWARINDEESNVLDTVLIYVLYTGQTIGNDMPLFTTHLGTFIFDNLVYHVSC